MTDIRAFQKSDTARVVDTMAAAFEEDALYRYFVPEDAARQSFLKKFMAFRLRYGLKYGTVLVANGGEGAAIFLKPGHQMNPADLASLRRTAGYAALHQRGEEPDHGFQQLCG